MRFEKILIIGSGKIATDSAKFLCGDLGLKNVSIVESSDNQFSMLKSMSAKYEIPYIPLLVKEQITEAIFSFSKCRSLLVISANNRYLFPKEICELDNTEIINFHYGYLPRYRGMNIPTWVIYNNEPFTGVTWHYVTSEVDRGEIIAQQKIMLNDDITAYEVVRQGMTIGSELFRSFIPEFLEKRIVGKKIVTDEFVYLNKNLPENGIVGTDKRIDEIYRLLRSFDYGRTGTLKPLKIIWGGKDYYVEKYSLEADNVSLKSVAVRDNVMTICENDKKLTIRLKDNDV